MRKAEIDSKNIPPPIGEPQTRQRGGGQAFPGTYEQGLTRRDWFAGQIAAGLAGSSHYAQYVGPYLEKIAKASYTLADALIAESAK